MLGHRPVLFSRGLLSDLKAFRKLAAGCKFKLNEVHCKVSGYPCGLAGYRCGLAGIHCQNYHVLASNCVQNYPRTSENSDRHSTGFSGFLLSSNHEWLSCISECHVLRRHFLTRTCVNSNVYRYRNNRRDLLNLWKDTFSCERQFSLSPKVILEASPRPLQPYLRLVRFDKPIGKYIIMSNLFVSS